MYTQGSQYASESQTDFMIDGSGFFAVRGTDGETYYTRNGSFSWSLDAGGNTILATKEGYPVLDRTGNVIQVPNGVSAESMVFSESGQIGYKDAASGNTILTDQYIAVYQFTNPAGLEKLSASRLAESDASGQPMLEGATAGLTQSKVLQGYLEGSNVQVADEMVNLIIAQRAYELNSKAITTSDDMLETANNLKR
jgi:flagellar basal-body rod protein FlgG